MKSRKGYLLLECIVSLFVIIILSTSLYSILMFCNGYKEVIEDRVELYEQSEEIGLQINRLIENSKGIISIRDLGGNTITGDNNSYIKVVSIKCKYRDEYNTVKDKEISFKNNNKLFINTLNSSGNSEVGGYEIGDYVKFLSFKKDKNKISIKIYLCKDNEKYETELHSYIREF